MEGEFRGVSRRGEGVGWCSLTYDDGCLGALDGDGALVPLDTQHCLIVIRPQDHIRDAFHANPTRLNKKYLAYVTAVFT